MQYLLYSSTCSAQMFDMSDLDVMRTSARNNAQHGITGFLLRSNCHYFQFIEGPTQALEQLQVNIMRDPRHFGFQEISSGRRATRRFGPWSMGYAHLGDTEVAEHTDADTLISIMTAEARLQNTRLGELFVPET